MIATSIKQSKRLIVLGLDPRTADMYYLPQVMNEGETLWPIDEGYDLDDADQPAWSLSALLEVLPLGTELYKMRNDAHEIYYEIDCADATGWVGYEDSDPITAAYEMVCWLLEQGLIKKVNNND